MASLGKYPIDETREFNRGSVEQLVREADKNNIAEGIERVNCFDSVALSKIAYIPSSIGLCLGRLLHLPFSIKFALENYLIYLRMQLSAESQFV